MAAGSGIAEVQKILGRPGRRAEEDGELQTAQVSDLCRNRLLNYADTFFELAKSYDGEFKPGETDGAEADRQRVLSEKILWENRQLMKGHLCEMANIMRSVACEVMCYRPMEARKRRMLAQALREEGILTKSPCYVPGDDGREAIMLALWVQKGADVPAKEAVAVLSALFHKKLRLSVESPALIGREPQCFVLEEEPRYFVLTGFSRVAKESETVSGDNYAVTEEEKGRITVMLSDGTGSGEQAGRDSGQVLDLMEKLLEAGYETGTAVNMVNTALLAKGEEHKHPTLDVCDVNLYEGSCRIWKVGGAATFLKREGKVEELAAGILPLGIFRRIDLEPLERRLEDGDFLVMVSDGVVDAFGAEGYESGMLQAVAGLQGQNPGELAEKLLRMAICKNGGRIRDDMTVGVIGIWKETLDFF